MPSTLEFSSRRNERLFLLVLVGIQFTHVLDFSIMMPLGPQLMRALDISTNEFGLLLSAYSFTAAASGVLTATYIDRFDRRKLMLILYALFLVATLCCAVAPNYSSLLIARALAGAFGGVLGTMVQTMVADALPFERRGAAIGTIMAAFSLSTVAGVPLGLLLASHIPSLDWRAPFLFIALLSGVIFMLGYIVLPAMTSHMAQPRQGHILQQLFALAKVPNHLNAFAFITFIVMSSFTMFPYVALYLTGNVGMPESLIGMLYLCGGAATFFTSRLIGALSDKYGKRAMFKWVSLASFIPLLILTHLGPAPWWLVLIASTAFFVLVPGRMVPGMAMVSAAAAPQVRGGFMSLVSSVQMLMIGLASVVGGLIITRGPNGQIENYNIVGYLGVACGLLAIPLMQRIKAAPAA